jgi:alkanesulfonate monooxygenase SsuD/methylene tetrahydromethanopterin reductase-like flavin-dependent oxidoreductase (luciferase family)
VQIGIATLADLPQTPEALAASSAAEAVERRLALVLRQAELAEAVGLDHFAVGEHHSADFAVSSPAVVLAAVAARTRSLRLTSGVTVLSVHDPVRVMQDFATVDQLSGGRAEITVGRSAFVEPFDLFGYDVAEYDALFRERLGLLLRLRDERDVSWHGRFRAPLRGMPVPPTPLQARLPIWLGVGGSPQSVERAATLGLPMIVGHLGGPPQRPGAVVGAYRAAGVAAGTSSHLEVGIALHLLVTGTEEQARRAHPYYREFLRPKRPGGPGYEVSAQAYADALGPQGALMAGTAETVTRKLLRLYDATHFDRLQVLTDWGGLPEQVVLDSIARLGEEVAPRLRERASTTPARYQLAR